MALSVASAQSAASGIAILYEDFLRSVREEVISALQDSTRRARAKRKPAVGRAGRGCFACHSADQTASNYLGLLSEAGADSEPGRLVREPLQGLCLPHLAMDLDLMRSNTAADRLIDIYLRGEAAVRADLTEFIRKQDYRYREEGFTRAQASSWMRAVHRLVGEPAPTKEPTR